MLEASVGFVIINSKTTVKEKPDYAYI